MALSKNFSNVLRSIFPLRDFLYVLQLEEYELLPYLRSAKKFWFRRNLERRDTLRWTARARVTALATLLVAAAVVFAAREDSVWVFALVLAAVCLGMPLLVAIGHVVALPIALLAKHRLIAKATAHLAKAGANTTVIAIAGSYGKTTTKFLVYEVVRAKYKTQVIEGNINTTLGIADWILRKFDPSTQVLIVEMDAYHAGEIAASTKMVRPHISVLTSVGEQHMLRFGTKERMIAALAEVFTFARPEAKRICNVEVATDLVAIGFTLPFTVAHQELAYEGEKISDEGVSQSVRQNAALALAVAQALEVPASHVRDICQRFTLPDRRQKPTVMYGYEAIDDSYNISLPTAQAGIAAAKELAASKGKKLLVLTAGIPEFRLDELYKRNRAYGAYIANHADAAVVLKSDLHGAIAKGIAGAIPMQSAATITEAVALMPQHFSPAEYVLLVQPELTDLSY